jgi:hypothetical protein
MINQIFVKSIQELEELEIQYELEDCGMSCLYPTCKWYGVIDNEGFSIDVYVPIKLFE